MCSKGGRQREDLRSRTSAVTFNYRYMRCAQFGLWQGARCFRTGTAHTPQWVCNRRATQPQAKFGATRRAAVLFRPDFVARSLQIHCGICSSLAPRLAKKSLAANVTVFMKWTTKQIVAVAEQDHFQSSFDAAAKLFVAVETVAEEDAERLMGAQSGHDQEYAKPNRTDEP